MSEYAPFVARSVAWVDARRVVPSYRCITNVTCFAGFPPVCLALALMMCPVFISGSVTVPSPTCPLPVELAIEII